MKKYSYMYGEYLVDFKKLANLLIDIPGNKNIVGIFRGSLALAAHLSNILECDMSILKYQSRDGKDESVEWLLDTSRPDQTLIVVDDIYDTGKTFKKIQEKLQDRKAKYFALFGKDNDNNVRYLNLHNNMWIVFPWEQL